ncbi:type II secretion system protein [Candidatus Kaiserbacteria bacterium]|nr:type II secretion system protein [Candidatus Kaiserbacteria bacterium]
MNSLRKTTSGFTMIEILVVITIISLLTSVLFYSTTKARNKAKVIRAFNDIQQIETALHVYQQDAGSWPTVTTGPERNYGVNFTDILTCTSGCLFPGFVDYMSDVPEDLSQFSILSYHNKGAAYQCGEAHLDDQHTTGVSIRIGSKVGETTDNGDTLLHDLYEYMNEEIDQDDNPNCGRVRKGGTSNSIYYLIADN